MADSLHYPEGTIIYKCQHIQEGTKAVYVSIYAGEKVRIEICRLCSTMALGVITSSRIQEVIVDRIKKLEL